MQKQLRNQTSTDIVYLKVFALCLYNFVCAVLFGIYLRQNNVFRLTAV